MSNNGNNLSSINALFKEIYADYPWNCLGTNFWYENRKLTYKSGSFYKNYHTILKYE